MPTGQHLQPEQKLAVLQDLMAGQDSHAGIATTHKLATGTVDRLATKLQNRKNGTTLKQLAGVDDEAKSKSDKKDGRKHYKYGHLYKRMDKLRASGWTLREIAAHLKVPFSAMNYHFYSADKPRPSRTKSKPGPKPARIVRASKVESNGSPIHAAIDQLDSQIKKLTAAREALQLLQSL